MERETTGWLLFTPCFLPCVPLLISASPRAAQGSPEPEQDRAELKSGGTRDREHHVEGAETADPAGLVLRLRRRRRGDGAPAGPRAVQRHWGNAPGSKR